MYWKLYGADDFDQLSDQFIFPWSSGHTVVFALEDDNGKLHQLTRPLPANSNGAAPSSSDGAAGVGTEFPCGVYTFGELSQPAAWQALLKICPAHRIDLATYQASHPEFPAETVLQASGGKPNFKSLADWRELGALDERSQILGRAFDLPLNVLRLWARLDSGHRETWQNLFETHPFNKNYIRDIVLDLYDLSPAQRTAALTAAQEHAKRWTAREIRSRAYPANEVRDLVRELRSPAAETLRRRLLQLRRDLGLPKHMQLDWPVDLEQKRLIIQMDFSALSELEDLLSKTGEPGFQAGIQQILDEL